MKKKNNAFGILDSAMFQFPFSLFLAFGFWFFDLLRWYLFLRLDDCRNHDWQHEIKVPR